MKKYFWLTNSEIHLDIENVTAYKKVRLGDEYFIHIVFYNGGTLDVEYGEYDNERDEDFDELTEYFENPSSEDEEDEEDEETPEDENLIRW